MPRELISLVLSKSLNGRLKGMMPTTLTRDSSLSEQDSLGDVILNILKCSSGTNSHYMELFLSSVLDMQRWSLQVRRQLVFELGGDNAGLLPVGL